MTGQRCNLAILFSVASILSAPILSGAPAPATAEWKQEISNGYLPYRRLHFEDFPVNDRVHPQHDMFTWSFCHYNYRWVAPPSNGRVVARVTNWTVRSGFDRNKSSRKSWCRPTTELLAHEQGHLDIGELYGRRLARLTLEQLPTGSGSTTQAAAEDLKNKLEQMFSKYMSQAQAEHDAYDETTSHGTNYGRQKQRNAAIQNRLKQAGISPP